MEHKRAWLYCRTAQPDDMKSLDYQLACVNDVAQKQGYIVVGSTTEYGVGLDLHRSGLEEVNQAVRDGLVDVVVVQNLSRIGRNVPALDKYRAMLAEYGVQLVSANEISSADWCEESTYYRSRLMGVLNEAIGMDLYSTDI